jgi:hypothetical protein
MNNTNTINAGVKVTDGYFVYVVVADTTDGFLTVSLSGHTLRVLKSQVVLN